jgi:uncharacterized membrane protein YciS (DUF1049 family)
MEVMERRARDFEFGYRLAESSYWVLTLLIIMWAAMLLAGWTMRATKSKDEVGGLSSL